MLKILEGLKDRPFLPLLVGEMEGPILRTFPRIWGTRPQGLYTTWRMLKVLEGLKARPFFSSYIISCQIFWAEWKMNENLGVWEDNPFFLQLQNVSDFLLAWVEDNWKVLEDLKDRAFS
jgi:hypothetical protein